MHKNNFSTRTVTHEHHFHRRRVGYLLVRASKSKDFRGQRDGLVITCEPLLSTHYYCIVHVYLFNRYLEQNYGTIQSITDFNMSSQLSRAKDPKVQNDQHDFMVQGQYKHRRNSKVGQEVDTDKRRFNRAHPYSTRHAKNQLPVEEKKLVEDVQQNPSCQCGQKRAIVLYEKQSIASKTPAKGMRRKWQVVEVNPSRS